ncbi:tetratricopeptide repeat protein [Paracoccaceae bacterium]|nr:tetratricopeptide repeat protein [Paracoccaceae bacterium]MDC3205276.1 tetratricopeptide repeat protein [Paracoccaceae bacterium]
MKQSYSPLGSTVRDPPQNWLRHLIDLYNSGKFREALQLTEKGIKKFPNSALLHNIRGSLFQQLDQHEVSIESYRQALKISPDYAEAYYNMANAFKLNNQLSEALETYDIVVKLEPANAQAHYNIANTYRDKKQLEKSLTAYNRAIELNPKYAQAYHNMGVTLSDLGRYDAAIICLKKALKIQPNYAQAYYNLGITLQSNGMLNEAKDAVKKALVVRPDFVQAYNNFGVICHELGELDEAINAYLTAIKHNKNFGEAHYNLGVVFYDKGQLNEAISSFVKALQILPNFKPAYRSIGHALEGIEFNKPQPAIQKILLSLLEQKSLVRPANISKAAISLLKLEPKLKRSLDLNLVISEHTISTIVKNLSEIPLLLQLMKVCPIPDLDIELLLRKVRAQLLISLSSVKPSEAILKFQGALALQCFINEFLYEQTDEEIDALFRLEENVKKALKCNPKPNSRQILCLASYKPLHECTWAKYLSSDEYTKDVIRYQIKEPKLEIEIKSRIPKLTKITDYVSSKVKEQYEENPYPRWVSLSLPQKGKSVVEIAKLSKLKVFSQPLLKATNPNILIAGCGTGQHAISTACRFVNSKVTAIDLSLSSLSYAKRKTDELNIKNIEYIQADILDVHKLCKKFDIIESVGVLHHMQNPYIGWKGLVDCLNPGGLMLIGLYSAAARVNHSTIRREIHELGLKYSKSGVQKYRASIIQSKSSHHKNIASRVDFYNLSNIRDLLFHFHEHYFTIPQISNWLSKLGLSFSGFETQKVIPHFMKSYPNIENLYDLDKWHKYEVANPYSFIGMYQFWCQKIS